MWPWCARRRVDPLGAMSTPAPEAQDGPAEQGESGREEKWESLQQMHDLKTLEGLSPEDLKKEGNALYIKSDHAGAIEKYGLAIKAFEATKGDEPDAVEDRRALAVLYSNRAQASMAFLRQSEAGRRLVEQGVGLPKEMRAYALRASSDAGQAVELDEQNAKAWLRKGQGILCLSTLQQRAKESVRCIQRALSLDLPDSLKPEAKLWLQQGKAIFDNETAMPENCPQM
mmetsp:Transcript_50395/g.90596  ORF Transcript_50395/g.90596 Transcript_50395/m.90596 type:complete len:228 (+) Transcript_50395:36-719(+)